jgi:tungstate transport system ATP-binding protein
LTRLSQEGTSARNIFPGKIVKIIPLGLYQKVHLDCGFPLVAYVTNHSLEELSLTEGKEVKVYLQSHCHPCCEKKEI